MKLPENWKMRRVDSTGEVLGGRQRSPHIVAGDVVPYLRVANVFDGRIDFSDVNEMRFTAREREKYGLTHGDILLNEGQSAALVGRAAMYKGSPGKYCFQNTIVRYRAGRYADPQYALQLFRYCQATGVFERIALKTSSIAHLGVSRFGELELPFPSLPEQRRIAEMLSAWDDAIEKVSRIKGQKLALMQATRNDLAADPGMATIMLGDVFAERTEVGEGGDVLLSVTQSSGIIRHSAAGRKDSSSADRSKYKRVMPGDIAYNTMRMWQGASGLVSEMGVISPAYTVVVPDASRINAKYASHLFKSEHMMFTFERYSQGLTSDTWNLKYPAFSEIKIALPPLLAQQRMTALLDEMGSEIELLDRQLKLLRLQKRGLMQKLLTGEVRVTIDEVVE